MTAAATKLTVGQVAQSLIEHVGDAEWTASAGVGYGCPHGDIEADDTGQWVRFARRAGDVVCVVLLNVCAKSKYHRADECINGHVVEGHTLCNGATFTAFGVDVASVWLVRRNVHNTPHTYTSIAALLAGEFARCVQYVERKRTALPVPGLAPFTRQPEWFVEAGEKLRKGQTVTLAPRGMGTGYSLTMKPIASLRFRRAAKELETLLNASGVYVEAYDHD